MEPYKYNFNVNNCLYKSICGDIETDICNSVCERYIVTNFLLHYSDIPIKQRQRMILTVPQCDYFMYNCLTDIRNNIDNYVEEGKNIYIYSHNTHNGKTSWAINLMLKYFDRIWQGNGFVVRGVFVSVPMFLMQCKNVMSNPDIQFEQFKQTLRTADLVIWDDIATSKLSSYDINLLFAYISERLTNGKSNIYTGNMEQSELTNSLGVNLGSRIWNNSNKIKFNAESWVD